MLEDLNMLRCKECLQMIRNFFEQDFSDSAVVVIILVGHPRLKVKDCCSVTFEYQVLRIFPHIVDVNIMLV